LLMTGNYPFYAKAKPQLQMKLDWGQY
jgi:hypothetical protein